MLSGTLAGSVFVMMAALQTLRAPKRCQPTGLGVGSRETVAEVARTLDRSRFRRIGLHSACEAALVSALL